MRSEASVEMSLKKASKCEENEVAAMSAPEHAGASLELCESLRTTSRAPRDRAGQRERAS